MFRSKKLLEKMRDLPCSVCGSEDGTVVAAHRNEGKGMGLKVSDALVTPMCARCHYDYDQGRHMSRQEKREHWNRAYIQNIKFMLENGHLKLG